MKRLRMLRWLVLVVLVLVAGCQGRAGKGKLVYGLTLSPSNIDPHVGASSELGIPLTSVYDPLVWLDPEGNFVPGLAENWTLSADGTQYTFSLRKGVTFHDGTPLDADAVCFSLDRIADPDTRSTKARSLLGPYAGCEAIDDMTARVSFDAPHAAFLSAASQVYLAIVSPTAVARWGSDYQFHQVGTGPFEFVEYVPNDHLTLRRYVGYRWAPSFFEHQGPAYLAEVEFRFYTDPATRAAALESGQVRVMGEIPPADAKRLKEDPDFYLVRVPLPGQPLQVYMNTTRAPLDDIRVRRALVYGADRQAIVDTVFMGYSPPAAGPLTRVTWGYDPVAAQMYPYEPEAAAQLLSDAGWVDSDNDGVRDRGGQPLVLDTVLMGWGFMPEVGQMLQAQYADLGIQLDMQVLPYPAAVQAAEQGDYHLIPFVLSSSDPQILRSSFHSSNISSGFNWSKVSDPELDEWLDRAAQAVDNEQRMLLYRNVQQRIMDLALIIPIRDYVNLNGVADEVSGLRYDGQGWFPWLYDVRLN